MQIKLVKTFKEALDVLAIRNECRSYLTNRTRYISIPEQLYWYFSSYKAGLHNSRYRVYLARNDQNQTVGYGALRLKEEQLLVTECVKEKFRGQGWGKFILKELASIARDEKLPMIAEIWATNKVSLALHTKYGFNQNKTMIRCNAKLVILRKDQ